ASKLSPTQMVSKAPEPSAAVVKSMRSRAVTAPSTTARLGRMRPSDGIVTGSSLSRLPGRGYLREIEHARDTDGVRRPLALCARAVHHEPDASTLVRAVRSVTRAADHEPDPNTAVRAVRSAASVRRNRAAA